MRVNLAGRMVLFFAATAFAAGCRTTSVARDPDVPSAQQLAQSGMTGSKDIGWQRAAPAPSTAMAQDTSVKAMAFQGEPAPHEKAAFPDLLPRSPTEPRPAPVQPVGLLHGRHPAAPLPVVPIQAANEGTIALVPSHVPVVDYVIRPPDVLFIESARDLMFIQPIYGPHAVSPDGKINLGRYGSVSIAGKTVQQAREEVARAAFATMAKPRVDEKGNKIEPPSYDQVLANLKLSVTAFNSSVYYVITEGAGHGQGEQVYRLPMTGNDTVLDAISHINGLPFVSSRNIWVARRNLELGPDTVLPVDWKGITQQGSMNTNWYLQPGDRVYVKADSMRRFNNNLGKMLEPIERVLGATLLGGQAVNTIKNGTTVVR